ncbi:hypothetical protein CLOM_g474, partial [Closterium sp. NIES-68]
LAPQPHLTSRHLSLLPPHERGHTPRARQRIHALELRSAVDGVMAVGSPCMAWSMVGSARLGSAQLSFGRRDRPGVRWVTWRANPFAAWC